MPRRRRRQDYKRWQRERPMELWQLDIVDGIRAKVAGKLAGKDRAAVLDYYLGVRRPDRPELLLVKRAVRREGGGWWVEGDNTDASDDSRVFGPVPPDHVLAKAVARYLPSPRRL